MSTICFVLIFSIGTQFFLTIPFYQLYPSLNCYDKLGNLIDQKEDKEFKQTEARSNTQDGYCSRQYACESPKVHRYEIDWQSETSIHNWTTKLDLICEEPYKIAFIGSLSFFSFAIGSILFTNNIDHYGRKKVLVASALVTPISMLLMLLTVDSIESIYIYIFIMGLTYNTRGSTSYMYAIEFMEDKNRLIVGQTNFISQGLLQAIAGLWFYLNKN